MNNFLNTLKYEDIPRPDDNVFHASDYSKPILDIYYRITGVPKTNPPEWYDTLKWEAGKGVELGMLKLLKYNGIVDKDYDQNVQGAFSVEREGVTINGHCDAININGEPIEIKSVNNKNAMDIKAYEENNPRENYVGQLAIYMDILGKDKGYLFACSIDGLNTFWFECNKIGERKYKCGNVEVDLDKEYKKWSKLKKEYIDKGIEPSPWQYVYKRDVDKINWKEVSASDISKARNGHKVLGDYQVSYSPYKNLIIERQGSELGYTLEELEKINVYTKGYTSKEWK